MTSPKITFIGAGSTVFARALLRDILLYPALAGAEIRLMDIDPRRLQTTERIAAAMVTGRNSSAKIVATTDRQTALDGADYVITMFQVGGYDPATIVDFEIPKRYGIRQTIGDTLGIGGIMRGLRSIPVLLGIARDMERLCPNALLLNYSNPMAMLVWSVYAASTVSVVGLCHSVQGTAAEAASWLDVPSQGLRYRCAGINHMAFYLTLERDGTDLYPALRALAATGNAPAHERVRFDVLKRWGYLVTESSEHFSEYVPWYIKRVNPDLIDVYNVPLDEYPRRCEEQIAGWQELESALLSRDSAVTDRIVGSEKVTLSGSAERRLALVGQEQPGLADRLRERWLAERAEHTLGPSGEYGIEIINAMETGRPATINGNVRNAGLIANLPDGCCVEVPCLVDGNGVQPTVIGALPPQLAALMRTNVGVQELTVQAALTGNRDYVYQAAMLDPRTATELDPAAIESLVDDLLAAHGPLVPALADYS
ncbi:MAG: alpha-glucosidase/alpha-galactosidase [Thermomicrobiales bacterium]